MFIPRGYSFLFFLNLAVFYLFILYNLLIILLFLIVKIFVFIIEVLKIIYNKLFLFFIFKI